MDYNKTFNLSLNRSLRNKRRTRIPTLISLQWFLREFKLTVLAKINPQQPTIRWKSRLFLWDNKSMGLKKSSEWALMMDANKLGKYRTWSTRFRSFPSLLKHGVTSPTQPRMSRSSWFSLSRVLHNRQPRKPSPQSSSATVIPGPRLRSTPLEVHFQARDY